MKSKTYEHTNSNCSLPGYSEGSLNKGTTRGTRRTCSHRSSLHKAAALSTAQVGKDARQHAGVGSLSFVRGSGGGGGGQETNQSAWTSQQ